MLQGIIQDIMLIRLMVYASTVRMLKFIIVKYAYVENNTINP